MEKESAQLHEDVGGLKESVKNIKETLGTIQNNHLVHLQSGIDEVGDKINNLSVRIAWMFGVGGTILIGIQIWATLHR